MSLSHPFLGMWLFQSQHGRSLWVSLIEIDYTGYLLSSDVDVIGEYLRNVIHDGMYKFTLRVAIKANRHPKWFIEEERKRASQLRSCYSAGISFVPLVVETIGGWSHEAVETIESIGCLPSQRLGFSASQSISYTFQQLAIRLWNLWRGNACMHTCGLCMARNFTNCLTQ